MPDETAAIGADFSLWAFCEGVFSVFDSASDGISRYGTRVFHPLQSLPPSPQAIHARLLPGLSLKPPYRSLCSNQTPHREEVNSALVSIRHLLITVLLGLITLVCG